MSSGRCVRIVDGDLLDSQEKYLCHQCNCLSKNALGIAKAIYTQYEWSDVYKIRKVPSEPGTISVCGDPSCGQRFVVNMFAQYFPGRAKGPEHKQDGTIARLKYFQQCLDALSQISDLESVAFPWGIGCGLGGGDWAKYKQLIENFAQKVEADVVIYRLPTPPLQITLKDGKRCVEKENETKRKKKKT
jgi:O-acetyl-ADP-ribose deacetylase (regulator of RNase III)